MTVCLNNPVLGREITDNFTFDDANNQIVPKPGTDTKAGALALNLGNATGDTTNATDALTAAGFNAMANAVDSTAPLCGNEIQQAVTAAVGQSIACDAAAQQAIACAIASNPDAVACLKAVLPSGIDDTGTILLDSHPMGGTYRQAVPLKWENGVTTQLAAPVLIGNGDSRPGKNQNPGKFTGIVAESGSSLVYALDPTTNAYSTQAITSPWANQQDVVVNHEGTRVAFTDSTPGDYKSYNIAANGTTLTALTNGVLPASPLAWVGEDLITFGNTKNVVTGGTGTCSVPMQDPYQTAYAISKDYSHWASVIVQSGIPGDVVAPIVRVAKLTRTGNDITHADIGALTVNELTFPSGPSYPGAAFRPSTAWTPDNSQLIVTLTRRYVQNGSQSSFSETAYDSMCFVVNVTATTISIDIGGIRPWGSSAKLSKPRISSDGNYMIMDSYTGTAIFKKADTKWIQIGLAAGVGPSTIVGGAGGYSNPYNEL